VLEVASDWPLASQTLRPPGIASTVQGGGNRRMAIIPYGKICYPARWGLDLTSRGGGNEGYHVHSSHGGLPDAAHHGSRHGGEVPALSP
jgi:hypothetical protein